MIIDFNKNNGGGGDMSNYYTKSETDAAIEEAIEGISGGTSNPQVLKSIEVNDFDWSDEQVIEDYQLQVGDVVAINVIDPEGTFEHREYDDIPKTYINNSELKEISLAEFAETVQSNRNVPVLEFWFGTSKVYGEGDCYRCYWDDDENNWLIESTNGASTEGLYVEWSEGDGQYFLYKNNNINAKAPVATIVFILENVEYETDNENQVEGWSVSSRLEDEREYFITKVNDSLYVEGLGETIDTKLLQVHQEGDWLKSFVDWDNLDSLLNNDYYTKQEVDDAIAASGGTVDLSGYYTSAQTETAITSKGYITSADVSTQIEAYNYTTSAETEQQIAAAIAASGGTDLSDYYTSAQTETAITSKGYITSAYTGFATSGSVSALTAELSECERVTSVSINEIKDDINTISGATANMVTSAYATGHTVTSIWQGTQDDYNILTQSGATADATTFYIIKNNG